MYKLYINYNDDKDEYNFSDSKYIQWAAKNTADLNIYHKQ